MTRSIVVEYELSKPPAQVWRALTEPKLLASWLMENDIAPVVGHRFTFRAKPMPGWDGTVHCEVLEVEPLQKISYSWRGADIDTVVTWTLRETASGGTHLHLEHAGFEDKDAMAFDGLGSGWRGKVAERMEQAIEALG